MDWISAGLGLIGALFGGGGHSSQPTNTSSDEANLAARSQQALGWQYYLPQQNLLTSAGMNWLGVKDSQWTNPNFGKYLNDQNRFKETLANTDPFAMQRLGVNSGGSGSKAGVGSNAYNIYDRGGFDLNKYLNTDWMSAPRSKQETGDILRRALIPQAYVSADKMANQYNMANTASLAKRGMTGSAMGMTAPGNAERYRTQTLNETLAQVMPYIMNQENAADIANQNYLAQKNALDKSNLATVIGWLGLADTGNITNSLNSSANVYGQQSSLAQQNAMQQQAYNRQDNASLWGSLGSIGALLTQPRSNNTPAYSYGTNIVSSPGWYDVDWISKRG